MARVSTRVRLSEKLRRIEESLGKGDVDRFFIAINNENGTYMHGDESLTKDQLQQQIENSDKFVIIL